MSVSSGSVVMSCMADVEICMRGEKEVPRRSPGSSLVDTESGVVWYSLETKISVSEETPSRGSMSTRERPVRAGTPDERTKLTRTRVGVVGKSVTSGERETVLMRPWSGETGREVE